MEQKKYSYFHIARGVKFQIKMSFFSTAEILKSLISGDLVNSVVSSNEFKIAMGQVDDEKYLSKEVIEQLINNIF